MRGTRREPVSNFIALNRASIHACSNTHTHTHAHTHTHTLTDAQTPVRPPPTWLNHGCAKTSCTVTRWAGSLVSILQACVRVCMLFEYAVWVSLTRGDYWSEDDDTKFILLSAL